jgi:hypothetical protein
MSLPKLKRPVGRQSLAELLADLAGQVDDLKLAFEFYSSPIAELIVQVDREDVVEGLTEARSRILSLAIDLNLGKYSIHEPEEARRPVPILDLIEDRNGAEVAGSAAPKPQEEPEPVDPPRGFSLLEDDDLIDGDLDESDLGQILVEGGSVELPDLGSPGGPEWSPDPRVKGSKALEAGELATPDPDVNREPRVGTGSALYFDVKVARTGERSDIAEWVCRIEADGFIDAERAAEEILGIPPLPRKMMATVASFGNEEKVAKAGGCTVWWTRRGTIHRAAVLTDWRRLVGEGAIEGDSTVGHDRRRLMPRKPSEEAEGAVLDVAPKEAVDAFIEEFKEVPLLDGELPLVLTPDHEATETLDTDDLLLLAAHRRIGMDDRWETMEREGGTDLEIRAALGRAFDLGVLGMKGVVREPGGCCCFEGGDLPKFWSGKTNFEGRPTLEGKALVERARRVLEIPLEAGGTPPPKTKARGRKVKFAS